MHGKRHISRYAVFKIVLLFGFSAFFLIIILTGAVSYYVHPRIEPYMIFSSIVMTLIAFLMMARLKLHTHNNKSLGSLIFFAVPLLLVLILPPQPMGAANVNTTDLLASSQSATTGISSASNAETDSPSEVQQTEPETFETQSTAQPDLTMAGQPMETDVPAKPQMETLLVTSNNFYDVLNALYDEMDQYQGRRIEMTGFVFVDPENFDSDQFVPARLLMTCCAADMVAVGVLCRYDDASSLEEDSWVRVAGTVSITEFMGETVPCIEAESVTPATAPDDEYIYPY